MSINCGNCKGQHESAAEVKACFTGKKSKKQERKVDAVATPAPEKLFSVKCRHFDCGFKMVGTRMELAGWQFCPEHESRTSAVTSPFLLVEFIERCKAQKIRGKAVALAEEMLIEFS